MAVITVKIKASGDKKHEVQVDTDATIEDLKTIIEAATEVPAASQRLIYSGKVLKDAQTVALYKIQNDHSVHLVKGSAAKAAALALSPAAISGTGNSVTSSGAALGGSTPSAGTQGTTVPSNIAAGQGSFNPLADLTGARYAGYTQLPSASMFGPDGGMGAFPDPEQLEGIMLSPAFQEQMNALMLDPRMLDMMIDQNPQLRNMGPEARQMLRPMFREMMSNPESMRSMMNMGRAAQASGLGGMGGLGGLGGAAPGDSSFPAPGSNPTVEDGAAATGPDSGAGSGAGAAAANPFLNMFGGSAAGAGGAPGLNPFALGGLGGLGGAPQAAPVDNRPPEEKYENQLSQLNEMGFSDFDQNVAALRRSGGNVQGALEFLLSGGF
ncbi:ubiquitin-domain-containing protein [Metschnikowia bicuspidata var. bicuspidata NRRL YB-4993]|uniref:Ubiquitin-domain-containing protein n=1 Tax=Metschnikowia bicuspidata var. bicuspidata NRRL YB-4993 TaxID=869754 RepID=A0A1A0HF11_9ASCO|nr:ubiquitin-domain-containing protein [Metschnikowia bicuspidata var. bicuspidata NRRL YB-4993]OBA22591.1 ubiquitin-domain-containing protein [Metschnikowia bicuspidata var. bicuspidata NRRL YB-4993]